ncbi:hypothetical protein H0H92_002542 [Tricholoma furcatifolium]|nr:hypothetical protein H0H92_002542 [Tricholoma furcatifolium]
MQGLTSMPSMEREDDEDLACNHVPSPIEASSTMHLSDIIIWDDLSKDVLVPNFPKIPLADACHSRSDGENEFPIDMELDHHHVIIGEEDQDCEGLLDSVDEFAEGLSLAPYLLNQNTEDTFPMLEFAYLSPVLDLDDSDDETCANGPQATSHDRIILPEDPLIGEGLRVSNIYVSHIPHTESSLDQNSQDEVPQRLEVEYGSQATLEEPQALPSNSGLVQLNEYWPQLSAGSGECDPDIFATDEAPSFIQEQLENEDDLEFGSLSDSFCDDCKASGYSFDRNLELFDSGDSVAIGPRPCSPDTTLFSDQATTLNITWPLHIEFEDQVRQSLNTMEDSDEELWIDADGRYGEDEMLYMMELDLVAP